jgi:toxin HigB-1
MSTPELVQADPQAYNVIQYITGCAASGIKGMGGYTHSDRRAIAAEQADRIERVLDRLDASRCPEDITLPGYCFHGLKGGRRGEHAVSVSGNGRITFGFDGPDAVNLDLEDYH